MRGPSCRSPLLNRLLNSAYQGEFARLPGDRPALEAPVRTSSLLPILALTAFATVGLECQDLSKLDLDSGGGDTGLTDLDDTGLPSSVFRGTISGMVYVQLYAIDDDDEYIY